MAIALPLFLQVLLPLGLGMIMNARYDEEADMTRRIMSEIANISLALSSAQRNYAAAFVIAQGSFATRPDVFLMLLAASLIGMILVLFVASELGRRARHARSTRAQSV